MGARVGDTPGAGLEFFDQREYEPGDDLRRIDWRSVARTDRYMVRRYAQESSPWLDIVVDCSASMAATEIKSQAVLDLVQAFEFWGDSEGGGRGTVRCWAAHGDRLTTDAIQLDRREQQLGPFGPLRAKSRRILVSDFLFRHDPTPAIRRLAADASQLEVVQLLDPTELDPRRLAELPAESQDEPNWSAEDQPEVELVDCESGGTLTVRLDDDTLTGYLSRLRALQQAVATAARSASARYAQVVAGSPREMFMHLLANGIVETNG